MCVSCINEPQGTTVRDERNEVVLHRYWTSVQHVDCSDIRKLECLYFCLALLPYRFIFIPSIFILPDLIPACAYILSSCPLLLAQRSHVQKRKFGLPFPFPLICFVSLSSHRVSTRTNRAFLTISKSLRFIVLSLIHFLPLMLSRSLSRLFRVFLSELQSPTKCGNCR